MQRSYELVHPFSMMLTGLSGQGKTVLALKILREFLSKTEEQGGHIFYVTKTGYDITTERELMKFRTENQKSMTIIQATSVKNAYFSKILEVVSVLCDTVPKMLVIDNMTYDLDTMLLDFLTINRKVNCSVMLLNHDLFASRVIMPRLRGCLTYIMLFYLGSSSGNLKYLVKDKTMLDYFERIKPKSFTFLFWKTQENSWSIEKSSEVGFKVSIDERMVPRDDRRPVVVVAFDDIIGH